MDSTQVSTVMQARKHASMHELFDGSRNLPNARMPEPPDSAHKRTVCLVYLADKP